MKKRQSLFREACVIPLLLAAGLCFWSCGTQDPDAQQDALSSQLRKGRSSVGRTISIRSTHS